MTGQARQKKADLAQRLPRDPARLFLGLIAALGLILCATFLPAQEALPGTGAPPPAGTTPDLPAHAPAGVPVPETLTMPMPDSILGACLEPHGDPRLYRAGLQAMGWFDVPQEERPRALAMLADAYLAQTGPMGADWETLLAHRATDAPAFWENVGNGRTLMQREGSVLLLAGVQNAAGELLVECWTAAQALPVIDVLFSIAGEANGDAAPLPPSNIREVAWSAPLDIADARFELYAARVVPPLPPDPPLAATDALRTVLIFTPAAPSN